MKQSKRKRKVADAEMPSATDVPVTAPVTAPASASSYSLPSMCTMREAAALKAELLKLASAPRAVVLDVHAVERIDTSAMQLLCAFVRDRRARRLVVRWQGKPEAFTEAVETLGLGQALNYAPDRMLDAHVG